MAIDLVQQIEIHGYKQQMEFIKSPSVETAFIAGLGSGKSHAGAQKALSFCLANPGSWGIVTAPQNRILEIATLPTYDKVFPNEFVLSKKARPHHEWRLVNGCRIFFWSTDKPETISGAELAWSHMDEGSLSPYLAYVNIKKRLRQRDGNGKDYPYRLWITTTPRQLNWLYKELTKDNSHIQWINASTRDNIYLDNVEEYINRMGLTGKDYEQDIEGKFVLLSGDCLFTQETLDMQLTNCYDPIEIRDNGMTQIWRQAIVGVNYVAAADCADEGGGGVNCLVILDPQSNDVMAEINADIPADKFALMCNDLLKEYYNPLFAPERNGTVGGIVITKMQALEYPNLYKDHKDKVGWYTVPTGSPPVVSKFQMLQELEEDWRLRRWVERSTDAIGEASTLIREEGTKYKPRAGYRDDRIMARAICNQLRKVKKHKKAEFHVFQRERSSYTRPFAGVGYGRY